MITTIKKLKELIKDLPDDTPVLIPGHDHSYRNANIEVNMVLQYKREWFEYHGDEYIEIPVPDDIPKKINTLIIR